MVADQLFLSAFLQVLFDRLTPHAGDLWKLAFSQGLEKKLETLVRLFRKIEAVLADAEKRQLTEDTVKLWLDDLRDLAYNAEDVLDELSTEALRREVMAKQQTTTSKVMNLMPALKFKIKMGSKIDAIMNTLEVISKQKDQLSLVVSDGGASGSTTNTWKPIRTTPELIEPVVYGREKDKKNIIHMLLTDDQKYDVIPIVGMGGAGKTTLAQHVYNDQDVAQAFEKKAWVCVSNDFDVIRLMKEILVDLTDQSCEFNELQPIQKKLNAALNGKRFLIVLDDIWDHTFIYEKWLSIEFLLRIGAPGSKMIVTTRQKEVAEKMRITEPYMLKLLSNDDCWLLFGTHAFKKRGVAKPPDLELIRKKIVDKCDGLPLAARTLGALLGSKTSDRWEEILNSKIWNEPKVEGGILNVLRLSYHYLPPHLKKCFVHCAIFHQDYSFTEDKLVLLWIAEGLIPQTQGHKQLIQEGQECFRALVSTSLLQASDDDGSKYTMHDLVHDLAKEVGGELYFQFNDVSESQKENKRARHASYVTHHYDNSKRFEIFLKTKHLRTFLPFQMIREHHQYVSCSILNLTFRLKKLRVLSFHGYHITELSDSIENLKHLRYLDLSSTQIKFLPETTCSLHNLLILSLRDCKELQALPSKMENLINLFYLDITNAHSLQELPIGLKELKSLQILSNFIVGKSNGCGLKELMNFKDLSGKIHISSLDNVVDAREAKEASLDKKNNLRVLVLEWSSTFNDSRDLETNKNVLQLLQPTQNLEELTIINYGGNVFSKWLGDSLFSSIKMLKLEDCKLCTCLPPLGQLPSLKTLQIKGMRGVKSVGENFYGSTHSKTFISLESLSFVDMSGWNDWSDFDVNEQAEGFSCLSVLSIVNCPNLSGNLPKHLPSLKELVVHNCEKLNVVISNFPKLYKLDIYRCLELISRTMPSTIESLTMMHCPAPVRFPTTLCSLTCLRKLRIDGCWSLVSLPRALFLLPVLERVDLDDLLNLRTAIDGVNDVITSGGSLTMATKKLEIRRCPSLVCILTRGRLPASLTHLVISSCPRLEFVTKTFLENTKLESITIIDCEKFQQLAEGMRLLDHLKYIEIIKCPNLLSFPQGGLASNKLEALVIKECKNLEALPDGIGNITSLARLHIVNCERIKFVAEEGLFINLKELNLEKCPEEMEGILTKFPISLTLLTIKTCRKLISLRSLPIHLVELKISYCGEMTTMPNIPITLTQLSISECRKLTTLPNNLSTSSLIELNISDCGEITSLPNPPLSLTDLWILECPKIISLPNLSNSLMKLGIYECRKLTTLPNNLSTSSLIELKISGFEMIRSLPDLPICLIRLCISECKNLENMISSSSSNFFRNLTSLQELEIWRCPKLKSLPKEGLPSSLLKLKIIECPMLSKRCKMDKGKDWHKIAHIPYVSMFPLINTTSVLPNYKSFEPPLLLLPD